MMLFTPLLTGMGVNIGRLDFSSTNISLEQSCFELSIVHCSAFSLVFHRKCEVAARFSECSHFRSDLIIFGKCRDLTQDRTQDTHKTQILNYLLLLT